MFESLSIFSADNVRSELFPGIGLLSGWYDPEENMVWSKERKAFLEVGAISAQQPVSAMVTLATKGATIQSTKNVTIRSNGEPIGQHEFKNDLPVTLFVEIPKINEREYGGVLEIETDRTHSPYQLGKSADERQLGVSLLAFDCVYSALSFPLSLSEPLVAHHILRTGWHWPVESEGIWSHGKDITIHLNKALFGEANKVNLVFECFSFAVVPGQTTTAVVRQADKEVATWHFKDGGLHLQPLTIDLKGLSDDEVVLSIDVMNAKSPQEMGVSADPRTLGILLQKICQK